MKSSSSDSLQPRTTMSMVKLVKTFIFHLWWTFMNMLCFKHHYKPTMWKKLYYRWNFQYPFRKFLYRQHIRGSDFEEAGDLWLIGSFCMVSDSHWVTPTSHYIVVTGKTRFFERRTTVIWKSEQSKSYGYVLSKIDTDMHWNRSFRDICRPRHPFHHYSV